MTIDECARHPFFAQCAAQLAAAQAQAKVAAAAAARPVFMQQESSPTCSSVSAASHLHVSASAPLQMPPMFAVPTCRLGSATDRQSGRHKAARVQSPPQEVRLAPVPAACCHLAAFTALGRNASDVYNACSCCDRPRGTARKRCSRLAHPPAIMQL